MAYLLDVNVLLALCDPRHVHHDSTHRWFQSLNGHSWATCPLTENGFVRVASHPRYPNSPGGPVVVGSLLGTLCSGQGHVFWSDSVTLRDRSLIRWDSLLSPSHITDVYLLALAVRNQGKLATLDAGIPAAAVLGGSEALEVISA